MIKLDFNAECTKYLALRESLGLRTDQIGPLLRKLAEYLSNACHGEMVRPEHVLAWVCSKNYSTSTQHVRISAARMFLRQLRVLVQEIQIAYSETRRPQIPKVSGHPKR